VGAIDRLLSVTQDIDAGGDFLIAKIGGLAGIAGDAVAAPASAGRAPRSSSWLPQRPAFLASQISIIAFALHDHDTGRLQRPRFPEKSSSGAAESILHLYS
jgi:hypothetical protein